MVKAVINGERVECGVCGALLFTAVLVDENGKVIFDSLVCFQGATYAKKKLSKLEIKCKHKTNGKTCNEINEILL